MSKNRFAWAKDLPKPDADPELSQSVQAVQELAAEVKKAAPAAEPQRQPQPLPTPRVKERMIDRRDGRARPQFEFAPDKIRGGKRSNQWGRASADTSPGDWVGVRLPAGTNARLKRMAAAHDLYVWQVMVEAIGLFIEKHGEIPKG